jgi:hypothetical protein
MDPKPNPKKLDDVAESEYCMNQIKNIRIFIHASTVPVQVTRFDSGSDGSGSDNGIKFGEELKNEKMLQLITH